MRLVTDMAPPSSTWRDRKPTKLRDQQRSKVYAAKRAAFPDRNPDMTLAQVESYVAEVWRSDLVAKILGPMRERQREPDVSDGRGRRSAASFGGRIAIPRWGRTKSVILHELAHELTWERPAHGPKFCENFLALVERFMGYEARDRLGAEMLKRRVKTRPAKKAVKR